MSSKLFKMTINNKGKAAFLERDKILEIKVLVVTDRDMGKVRA